MNIRSGYKLTELGEIPEEWEIAKLKDVILEAKSGFASGARDANGIIQLRMDNIQINGRVNTKSYLKVPTPSNVADFLLNPGDILLVNTSGSPTLVGKSAFYRNEFREAVYSNHITRIRANRERVTPEWLFYLLHRAWRSNVLRLLSVTQAGGQKYIPHSGLLDLRVPYAPLPEQHKIASVLSAIDASIQKSDEILQISGELRKGLLHDLLTKGIGHTRFTETRIGRIPKEWVVKELGEVAFVTKLAGFEFTEYFELDEDGPIIVLRALNIRNNRIDLSEIQRISKDLSNSLTRSQAHKDDIIFTYVGVNIGAAAIIPEDSKFHLGPNVARISVNNKNEILPSYLLGVIDSSIIAKQIFAHRSVTSQPSLSMSKIRKLMFPVPTPAEQQQIVNVISSVESKIEKQMQKKEKLEQLKVGLMQVLLTGSLRVKAA